MTVAINLDEVRKIETEQFEQACVNLLLHAGPPPTVRPVGDAASETVMMQFVEDLGRALIYDKNVEQLSIQLGYDSNPFAPTVREFRDWVQRHEQAKHNR